MKSPIRNIPASVQARLLRHAEATNRPFQEVFYYYAIERFLYRLSKSEYCKSFVLKGGLAFFGWGVSLRRPTRDIDFHAFMSNSQEEVEKVINEISQIEDETDGMRYDTSAIRIETIMADAKYEGVRVRFPAYLGRANIILQIDVSFANVITPGDIEIEYPTLLNASGFSLRGYNRETSIAEKFQAMVFLGNFNGRMKDFYDIYLLAKECEFGGSVLAQAFIATFDYRKTPVPSNIPLGLSNDFALKNQNEWSALLDKSDHHDDVPVNFEEVIEFLREFLLPPMQAAAKKEKFTGTWTPADGWTST